MSGPQPGVRKGCFFYFQAFPDLHVSLDEFVAEGDRVFLRSTMTGTHDGEFKGSRQQDVTLPSSQPRCTGLPTASSSAIGAWWR